MEQIINEILKKEQVVKESFILSCCGNYWEAEIIEWPAKKDKSHIHIVEGDNIEEVLVNLLKEL